MDCERIRDLLPDYHLGHLSKAEAEEVRRHLAEHPECREALAEISDVVDLIPLSMEPLSPPPELKGRILSRIQPHEPRESGERPEPRPRNRRRGATLLLASALGVLLVALFALTFAYTNLDRENSELRAEVERLQQETRSGGEMQLLTTSGTELAPEAQGMIVLSPPNDSVALAVYGMPELPAGSDYHAWLMTPGGEAVSLGEMEVDSRGDGNMTGSLDQPEDSYSTLEITRQPEGSTTHSGEVFLEAGL